jgi:hypothetical protein
VTSPLCRKINHMKKGNEMKFNKQRVVYFCISVTDPKNTQINQDHLSRQNIFPLLNCSNGVVFNPIVNNTEAFIGRHF